MKGLMLCLATVGHSMLTLVWMTIPEVHVSSGRV